MEASKIDSPAVYADFHDQIPISPDYCWLKLACKKLVCKQFFFL